MRDCLVRVGADTMITPREIIRDYMAVLNILYQNPEASFTDVVGKTVTLRHDGAGEEGEGDFSLADITL